MTMSVEFDLTAEQIGELLDVRNKGPLGVLAKRLMAKPMNAMAQRLAGPTTVEVSDAGLRITTPDGERQIDWSSVRAVNERSGAWVVALAPSGVCFIPGSAVPATERPDFSARLRALVGRKYKVREGMN